MEGRESPNWKILELMEQKYRHRWRDRDSDGIILEYIMIYINIVKMSPEI